MLNKRSAAPAVGADLAAVEVALRRLDQVLAAAVARFDADHASDSADAYSGAYVSGAEVARLLRADPPGGPGLRGALDLLAQAEEGSRLAGVGALFGLGPLERALLLLALAPALDRRYERIYGYLQDDMTRRRPTVAFALGLLAPTFAEALAARRLLDPDAPLLDHGLLRLLDDPQDLRPPLVQRYLAPEERLLAHLLGDDRLDPALRSLVRLEASERRLDELTLPAPLAAGLARLAEPPAPGLLISLRGPQGAGKGTLAAALVQRWGRPAVLVVDGERLAARPEGEFAHTLRALRREALLQDAPILFEHADGLLADERRPQREALLRVLAALPWPGFLGGAEAWQGASLPRSVRLVELELPKPDAAARVRLWTAQLDGAVAPDDLAAVAATFRLTPGQIRAAAATAATLARWRDPQGAAVDVADLMAAGRAQGSPRLASLARKVRLRAAWDDLVLPEDRIQQLRELCGQVRLRARVHEGWGFERRLALGRGLSALFAGQPGTGKTMAADVIAGELGLDLYKVDLATVVSKYIGETEKNLARVFDEAESSGAVLFFDEADALFGKRSEVKDAHDRYANLEIAYLLQRIEEYEGISILATNLRQNLDDAFVRRLQFIVEFPFPGAAERLAIWTQVWPPETPRHPGLDLELLAERYELAGGSIRNVALAAAFLAANNGGAVNMAHVAHALRREYQKMGRAIGRGEFDVAHRGT